VSAHHEVKPQPERFQAGSAGPLPGIFLGAGILGIGASIAGAFTNSQQFAYSWLFAFFYFFTLCAGSLFWILVHHATDAEWSVVVRRVLETKAVLIWLLAPLFLPLAFPKIGVLLWKWWTIPVGVDHVLDLKRGYLNLPFFYIRAGLFFVGIGTVAFLMRKNSTAQDDTGSPANTVKMRKLAFAGLPVFGVSLTFAAVDWLMGLDHHWFSTMWGVYLFAGAAGSSMALLVLTVSWLKSRGYLNVVSIEHYHIMGKWLLAFTIFWAYIGFDQYMLIWYANIPEETSYFIRRNIGTWWPLSTALVVCRFFIPFPFLLFQLTKKSTKVICFWACWILAMQCLDIYLIVLPMLHHDGFAPSWMELTSFVGIGGVLAFAFLKLLPSRNLYPNRDPRIGLSINISN
jgi:hypothetical protein